jgi:transposase-like protein
MDRKPYQRWSAVEKVAILKKVLVGKESLSKVCETHDLSPTLFYVWQKQFFENGESAFAKDGSDEKRELEREVDHLKKRLAKKDEVIAEIGEEYVKLKKELGEL